MQEIYIIKKYFLGVRKGVKRYNNFVLVDDLTI